jgi:hypothetical protein
MTKMFQIPFHNLDHELVPPEEVDEEAEMIRTILEDEIAEEGEGDHLAKG